jgi:hypothetical protein
MSNGITYAIMGSNIDKGMKSKGSKSLIEFNKRKLLDYQIDQINLAHKYKNIDYEIIVITNFECSKIEKLYGNKLSVYELETEKNVVIKGCEISKYKNIFFIDCGCVFEAQAIIKTLDQARSAVLGSKSLSNNLDMGIFSDKSDAVHSLFFDLSEKRFSNMFFLCEHHVKYLLGNKDLYRSNLMYFEIINTIIDDQIHKIYYQQIKNNLFIYFNNTRQKNGISKFIKKYNRCKSIL